MALTTQRMSKKVRRIVIPLLFLLPHLFFFGCFTLFPTLTGIFSAFTDWPLGSMPRWIGLENFRTLFFDSGSQYYWQFRWGLANTLRFVVLCVPFRIVVPLMLAWALNERFTGHRILQSVFYLPALLSLSVVMVSWNYMFNASYGVINTLLGLGKVKWMTQDPLNWIALVIITVWWGCGANMIIYQSALASVPASILEAAEVDGANAWQRFIHVTLPSIRFPLEYTLVTSVIAEFNIWGQPDMFNKGGVITEVVNGVPRHANKMIIQYIMENGFGRLGVNAGIPSAMALLLGLLIFTVSLLQFKAMRRNAA